MCFMDQITSFHVTDEISRDLAVLRELTSPSSNRTIGQMYSKNHHNGSGIFFLFPLHCTLSAVDFLILSL